MVVGDYPETSARPSGALSWALLEEDSKDEEEWGDLVTLAERAMALGLDGPGLQPKGGAREHGVCAGGHAAAVLSLLGAQVQGAANPRSAYNRAVGKELLLEAALPTRAQRARIVRVAREDHSAKPKRSEMAWGGEGAGEEGCQRRRTSFLTEIWGSAEEDTSA